MPKTLKKRIMQAIEILDIGDSMSIKAEESPETNTFGIGADKTLQNITGQYKSLH